jgi:hypothetical protein
MGGVRSDLLLEFHDLLSVPVLPDFAMRLAWVG